MKKITTSILSLFLACGMQAQFVAFDDEIDPQKGGIGICDINDDGHLDVIFSGVNIKEGIYYLKGAVMINNGDGTFKKQEAENVINPGSLASMKFADIDGNGSIDVIFNGTGAEGVAAGDHYGVAINDGQGVFSLDKTYPTIEAYVSCGFADFNNDGLLDYYLFGNGIDNCALFFQQTDGTFSKNIDSFGSFNFVDPEVSVVDFNNDGYVDIFINAYLNNPTGEDTKGRFTKMFVNDKFGGFSVYAQPNIIAKSFGSASWGDIDGDGWLDLVLNGDGWVNTSEQSDGTVRVYKNNQGLLEAKTTFTFFRQISVGGGNILVDWDNDGDLDIVVGGWSDIKQRQATSLYLNTDPSNFTFEESPLSNTYFPGVSENTFAVGDLNNDGKTDLLLMGFNGNQQSQVGQFQKNICGFCLNPSSATKANPEVPTGLDAKVDASGDETMVEFSWLAPASESGNKGTTYNLSLRNKTTGKWLYNPMAVVGGEKNGWRKIAAMGNVFTNKRWELYNLTEGEYEWTVQAINGAYLGGKFADVHAFTIGDANSISTERAELAPSVYSLDNKLRVNYNTETLLTVYNLSGGIVKSEIIPTAYETTLASGIYIVDVQTKSNTYKSKVIIK